MAPRKTEAEAPQASPELPTHTMQSGTAISALPPEHVDHAAVFYNEAAMRKQGFELGLAAIDAEIEGKRIEREEKIAAIERDHASDMSSLERRRTMMVVGIEMAGAALDKYEERTPSPEGKKDAEQQHKDAYGNNDQ